MKKQDLSKFSTDTLKQKELILKIVLAIFLGVLLILIGLLIFMISKGEINPLIAVPITLFPVLLISLKQLKDIRTEIQSRQ